MDLFKCLLIIASHLIAVSYAETPWSWTPWSNWTECMPSNSSNTTMLRTRKRDCVYYLTLNSSAIHCSGSPLESAECTAPCYDCSPRCFPCGGTMSCESGKITARLDETGTYYSNENCLWYIQRPPGYIIHLNFTKLDVGWQTCPDDRLEITDGADEEACFVGVVCQRPSPVQYTSKRNILRIRFHSGKLFERSGFEIVYTSQAQNQSSNDNKDFCPSCGGSLNGTEGTIMPTLSPFGSYLPNEKCTWTIFRPGGKAIALEFKKIDFADVDDYIKITVFYNGSIYWSHIVNSSEERQTCLFYFGDYVVLDFTSGSTRQASGFIVHYAAVNYTSDSPSIITPQISNTIKPTIAPTQPKHFCTVNVSSEWTSWSKCVSSLDQNFYGKRSRIRSCLPLYIDLDNGCSLPNETRVNGCRMLGYKTTVDFAGPCNNTCINNGGKICDTSINVNNSACTGLQNETESCVIKKRCSFLLLGLWSSWSNCQNTLAGTPKSVQSRSRNCLVTSFVIDSSLKCRVFFDGKTACSVNPIYPTKIHKPLLTWPYTACNSKCADNSSQTCKVDMFLNSHCNGSISEKTECNITRTIRVATSQSSCNISNCGISWANWGDCTSSCGLATRRRYATCMKNSLCDDNLEESESCGLLPCPVNGAWAAWTSWSECNKICVGGLKTRKRSCTNPSPSNGGMVCFGTSEESLECNFKPCPVNGGYSPWSSWSYCDQPCNLGHSWRKRSCNYPVPAFGGLQCNGTDTQSLLCNNHSCESVEIHAFIEFSNLASLSLNNSVNSEVHVRNSTLQILNQLNITDNVTVNCMTKGSFACNLTLFYDQVPSHEIVLFQNQVEDVGSLKHLLVSNTLFSSDDVPNAPASVICTPRSATAIYLEWGAVSYLGNTTSNVIFYREYSTETWKRVATSPYSFHHVITDLKEFTLYTIRVSASARYGNGISSKYIDCRTHEGVPARAPSNLTCRVTSSSSLYLEWDHLPDSQWLGTRVAYNIYYRAYGIVGSWKSVKVSSHLPYYSLKELSIFTRYEIQLTAETRSGSGPRSWIFCETDEDVPAAAPSQVSAYLASREGDIVVDWKDLPSNLTNGKLLGYDVCQTVVSISDERIQHEERKCHKLSRYATRVVLKGFPLYAKVRIEVTATTAAGKGPMSSPVYIDTCQCPKAVYVSWYEHNPYIFGSQKHVSGLLADFIKDAISQVCSICSGKSDHGLGKVRLFFNKTKTGKRAIHRNAAELKDKLSDDAHIFMPVLTRQKTTAFQKDYSLVIIAEDPGSVLLFKRDNHSRVEMLIRVITESWPPLVICILVGSIIGSCLWALERKQNPNEFNIASYLRGALSGTWWGIITMTTVGYGDITPKSFPGKLIAMVWMLVGPIINGIVVGTISTALTASIVEQEPNINGMPVAVVINSSQYCFAIRRNAKVYAEVQYLSNDAVINALENGVVKGALIDSISAAGMQQELKKKDIQVARFFKDPHGFGIVLSSEMVLMKNRIQQYVDENRVEILEATKKMMKIMEDSTDKDSDDAALLAHILQDKEAFTKSIIYLCVLIITVSLSTVLARRCYRLAISRSRRRISSQVAGSKLLFRKKCIENELLSSMNAAMMKIEKKFDDMGKKHDDEILKWFKRNRYHFGVLGWRKFGTMNKGKIVKKIKYDDIMITEL